MIADLRLEDKERLDCRRGTRITFVVGRFIARRTCNVYGMVNCLNQDLQDFRMTRIRASVHL